jgi:exosortase C (VPDSG-CTERM-specific)
VPALETLEMFHPQNRAAASETIVRARLGNLSASVKPGRRIMRRFWTGACYVILLLAAFGQPLLAFANYAAHSSLHSYILLIPLVSAYVLYLRRDQLPKTYTADFWVGITLLTCGLGLFMFTGRPNFVGHVSADNYQFTLLALSFLCCLAAGGFLFLGRHWMRAAAFPLAYLIFLVPMPDTMADTLETASKYASAEVANVLFHLSGVPFLRAGLFFQLPNIGIQVAQECSGIRSSWVLLMTSILASHLFLKTPWRRLVFVAFVIPLGILRNGFRIFVIGLLCVNAGPQMIHSLIHRRGGPAFFLLSLIPFLLLLWWLRKAETRSRLVEASRASLPAQTPVTSHNPPSC